MMSFRHVAPHLRQEKCCSHHHCYFQLFHSSVCDANEQNERFIRQSKRKGFKKHHADFLFYLTWGTFFICLYKKPLSFFAKLRLKLKNSWPLWSLKICKSKKLKNLRIYSDKLRFLLIFWVVCGLLYNTDFYLPECVTAVGFELLQVTSLHRTELLSSNCYC